MATIDPRWRTLALEMAKRQKTREMMDKLYAMTPEEVNRFLGEHFQKICSEPKEG